MTDELACGKWADECAELSASPPYFLLLEIFINQQEITTLTVIWARQLVSPQPKLGPVP